MEALNGRGLVKEKASFLALGGLRRGADSSGVVDLDISVK